MTDELNKKTLVGNSVPSEAEPKPELASSPEAAPAPHPSPAAGAAPVREKATLLAAGAPPAEAAPPEAARAGAGSSEGDATSGSGGKRRTKGFDPFRFQVMTVPPGLRSEMAQVKLPRLGHEYFKETLPPPATKAAEEAETKSNAPLAPKESTRKKNTLPMKTASDAPPPFEPVERTPTSLAVPMNNTPRVVLWGSFGLLVGIVLIFLLRGFIQEEPAATAPSDLSAAAQSQVAVEVPAPPPVAPNAELAVGAAAALEPSLLPSAAAPSAASAEAAASATPLAAATSSSASSRAARPINRSPSSSPARSNPSESSAQNSQRLWITPR